MSSLYELHLVIMCSYICVLTDDHSGVHSGRVQEPTRSLWWCHTRDDTGPSQEQQSDTGMDQ